MKKSLLILTLIFISSIGVSLAQKNIGIAFAGGLSKGKAPAENDSFGIPRSINRQMMYYGVAGVYRTNTMPVGKGGIGLNVPVTVGLSSTSLYFDGSAMIQYQIGALSSEDNVDKSGYYFGAGVGLVHATWIPIETGTHQIPNITSNSFTPIVEAGTRVRVGRAEYYTDLGLFYKFNSSPNAKHNIYGLKFTYYLK